MRASVLRLWGKQPGPKGEVELDEMVRFNEAIDQAIAESLARYTQDIDHTKERFLAILGHDLRADDTLLRRYVEIDGRLEKVLAVVKMHGSGHSKELRVSDLSPSGAVIGEPLRGYYGVTTGVPTRVEGHHGSDAGGGDDV